MVAVSRELVSMKIGGLLGRAALLAEQLRKRPCRLCGLPYNPGEETTCPYCDLLDNRGIAALLERREESRELGFRFFISGRCLAACHIACQWHCELGMKEIGVNAARPCHLNDRK